MPPQNREEALFAAALEKPPAELASFLEGACYGDPALRQRLQARLAAHDNPEPLPAAGTPPIVATLKLDLVEVEDEAVGNTIGRYKVLEKVGEGGCGVVYVAEQTVPVRRRVALKVIKLGMDTKAVVARFEAERQALAMMDHPNIAKVLDAGATEYGRPYFVMELVRGIRITEYCDQANLGTRERMDLFINVCHAIQHAHQKGIIHRDIKPSNILVTLHDGVPVPKVIDFGIAKATVGQTLTDKTVYTQLQQFIGTPAYTSPEQAEMSGLDIDTRSDIYSLGVLLYELLAGSTPFDAAELMSQGIDAMRKTIREKEPVRPSTRFAALKGEALTTTAKRRSTDSSKLFNQLKGDLDWIVMKCLEKDRTRRYETANGLALDLKRHLNNEPVLARPPSAAYKFQKTFSRNKLVFSAGAAVVLALALGILFSTREAARANREAARAVAAEAQARQQLSESEASRARALVAEKAAAEDGVLALQNMAGSYWQSGRKDDALKILEQVLTLSRKVNGPQHPATLNAMQTLALASWHAGRKDDALKLTDEILTLPLEKDPNPAGLAKFYGQLGYNLDALGLSHQAINAWQQALRLNPPGSPDIHYWLGKSLVAQDRYAEALPILRAAQKFFPDGARGRETAVRIALAEASVGKQDPKADPSNPAPDDRLFKAWVTKLQQTVADSPTETDGLKHLATVYLWLGETNEYQVQCQKLLELTANSTSPSDLARASDLDRAAKAYLILAHPDPKMLKLAAASARQALQMTTNDFALRSWFLVTAGMAEVRTGNLAEAERLLDEPMRNPDEDLEQRQLALAYRALARAHLGRAEEAKADFAELEKLSAAYPPPPALSSILSKPDLMAAYLAHEEARALLNPAPPPSKP